MLVFYDFGKCALNSIYVTFEASQRARENRSILSTSHFTHSDSVDVRILFVVCGTSDLMLVVVVMSVRTYVSSHS